MAMAKKLSVIIITKNEERMIADCLISVAFADEVIVVDTGSTDKTNDIATEMGAKVTFSHGTDYSAFRNDGLKATSGKWVLYIDADERVTPLLRNEILGVTEKDQETSAFAIPRGNIFLGKKMYHGGWGDDYVIRLFRKAKLKGWKNPLHEEPEYTGMLSKLENSMVHFSHRDLQSMLEKTLFFTKFEAQLRIAAHHPKIRSWRLVRVMATEFWLRFVKLSAWKDGAEGVIDGLFQVFNMFIIYARVWEMQKA